MGWWPYQHGERLYVRGLGVIDGIGCHNNILGGNMDGIEGHSNMLGGNLDGFDVIAIG